MKKTVKGCVERAGSSGSTARPAATVAPARVARTNTTTLPTAVAEAMPRMRTFKDISHYTVEINRLENDGDRESREAMASLFDNGIDPMVVIRWKDIFESLEAAVDACETVAHVLEGITLKQRGRRLGG